MRISELANQSGVPVATIKYYLREGLLPAGERTAATQASYGAEHVERLRLIRVLREVGQVPVAAVAAVLAAVDDPSLALPDVLALAHHALGPAPVPAADDAHAMARTAVLDFVAARGWQVDPAAPAVDVLAVALTALRRVVGPCGPEVFTPYAEAADQIARYELATIDPGQGTARAVAQIVVGTVVYEQALLALRRLAEEHYSGERFGHP
ncbi:MAG TPA: MerR family transcriptional regulator [Streptosporangiaceae bacterium]